MKGIIFAIICLSLAVSAFSVPIPPSPFAVSAKAAFAVRILDEDTGYGVEGLQVVGSQPSSKNIFGDLGYTLEVPQFLR